MRSVQSDGTDAPIGGGGTFNGGTITDALKIDPASAGTTPLEIDTPGHAGDTAFEIVDDLLVGKFTIHDTGDTNVTGALSVSGNTTLGGLVDAVQLYLLAEAAQSSPLMQVFDKIGGTPFQLDKDGYVVLGVHSAPADGAIAAGECALWFDQTNGAAKLMVKAKTADGTVVTSSLALAP